MLRAAILAGSIFFGAGVGGGVVAQVTTSSPFDWSSLAGGAVGSSASTAIMGWRLSKADKELAAARTEIRELHEKDSARGERIAVALENATQVLREVQQGMGAQIARSRPEDVARLVHQLEAVVDDLGRGRGRDT